MRKLYDESYAGLTRLEKGEQHMYGTMVTTPNDKKFMVRMLDETSQVRDRKKLALRVKELIDQFSGFTRNSVIHPHSAGLLCLSSNGDCAATPAV